MAAVSALLLSGNTLLANCINLTNTIGSSNHLSSNIVSCYTFFLALSRSCLFGAFQRLWLFERRVGTSDLNCSHRASRLRRTSPTHILMRDTPSPAAALPAR